MFLDLSFESFDFLKIFLYIIVIIDYLDYIEGRNLLVIPTSTVQQKNEIQDTTDEYHPETIQPSIFPPILVQF